MSTSLQVPLQVTFRGLPHSAALEDEIRAKAAKLEEFHPRITSCRVVVEELRKHHHQGRHFRVRIDLRVPDHREIVANREHDEDVYVALREAFDHAKRQLEDVAREVRGDIKAHTTPQHGWVARLFPDEGYGFIRTADGREFYFSRENVVHPEFDHLAVDSEVQFIEDAGGEGAQAKRVSSGKHHRA
jgi:ribosomal subunit interface protein